MSTSSLMDCKGIFKSFGKNDVLKGIDLCLERGDVLSIIGGNGAGKSTFMKIIMGIYQSDKGSVSVDGHELINCKPSMALSNGVYLVPQEPMLFSNMTVEENILMGLQGSKQENKTKLKKLLSNLEWEIDVDRIAMTLSIAEQQLVEIIKGIIRESKILILDEPTSSLTFNEIKSLFKIIETLKNKGVGIVYITHRLNEVFEISNRVAIMRDGKITLEGPVEDFDSQMLIDALLPDSDVLETIKNKPQKIKNSDEKAIAVLETQEFSGHGFKDVTLTVNSGEILGIAGVVGAGRTEFAETIFGRDQVLKGKVFVNGVDITSLSTENVIRNGLNYVPEDRFKHGIFKISDIGMNISSCSLPAMGSVFLKKFYEMGLYKEYQQSFDIKATGIEQEIGALSGGNQQKIVIARALASVPKILILDEPTRGIDAGAREDVYRIIFKLREQGVGILLMSSDMEEVVQLSDRAVTMYRGKINREFVGDDITPDNLMAGSFGVLAEVV